jgi:hypothetical protein
MKSDKVFTETQRFNQPVVIAGLALITLFAISKYLNSFYESEDLESTTISLFVVLLIDVLFAVTSLKTRIDQRGIHLKFFPFHLSWVFYSWEEIDLVEVKKYRALTQFGGWGIRYGLSGTKAFNTRGNRGIFIQFKTGRRRMIGTQKPEEAQECIQSFIAEGSPID